MVHLGKTTGLRDGEDIIAAVLYGFSEAIEKADHQHICHTNRDDLTDTLFLEVTHARASGKVWIEIARDEVYITTGGYGDICFLLANPTVEDEVVLLVRNYFGC